MHLHQPLPLPALPPAVALPEAKQLRERAAAARKLADTMRSALPARDKGRRRTEQLGLTELRALRGQAAELRVDMPELNSVAMALERVDVWQVHVDADVYRCQNWCSCRQLPLLGRAFYGPAPALHAEA